MQIENAIAVITGGASGLGAATAQAFVAAGAKVMIFDRDPAGAAFAAKIGAGFAAVDITDEASVISGLDQVTDLNVAMNCAGIAIAEKTLGRDGPHGQQSFARAVDINLNGTFNVARLAAARMANGGVIINTPLSPPLTGKRGRQPMPRPRPVLPGYRCLWPAIWRATASG